MKNIRFEFLINGEVWSREYSMEYILENGLDEDQIIEDFELSQPNPYCSCFNENQNHCECTPLYEDSKVTDYRILEELCDGNKEFKTRHISI